MKFIDILKDATKNLTSSKLRTILTIMAIVVGAYTLALTMELSDGVNNIANTQINMIGYKNMLSIMSKTDGNNSLLPNEVKKYNPKKDAAANIALLGQEDFDKVKKIPGIENLAIAYLIFPKYISIDNSDKYEISLSSKLKQLNMVAIAGEEVQEEDTGMIQLSEKYIQPLGFSNVNDAIGKKVSIVFTTYSGTEFTESFVIKGISPNSFMINNGASYISHIDAEALTKRFAENTPYADGKYGAFVASFPDSYSATELKNLKSELDKQGYTGLTVDDQIASIKGIISSIEIVLGIFGAIAILAATFGIVNTLLMSVYERVKEIGLMKALGMSSSTIFLLFSIEAALLGFLGSIVGILLAWGSGFVVNYIFRQQKFFGFEGVDLLSFNIVQMLWIVLGLVIVGLIAGVFPAIKAAKLDPITALTTE